MMLPPFEVHQVQKAKAANRQLCTEILASFATSSRSAQGTLLSVQVAGG